MSLVFDTTLYSGKPFHTGLAQMRVIYPRYMRNDFFGQLAGLTPGSSDDHLKLLLTQAMTQGVKYVMLDAEGPLGGDATLDDTIVRLLKVAKSFAPSIKFGNFAYPRGYSLQSEAEVRQDNDSSQRVLDLCDFGAPAAYPFWRVETVLGFNNWVVFTNLLVQEHNRCMSGKPCLPVLDLCYADYGWPGPQPVSGALPGEVLRRMVKVALDLVGGAVVWGATRSGPGVGGEEFATWDPMEDWYVALLDAGYLDLGNAASEQLREKNVATAELLNKEFPGA